MAQTAQAQVQDMIERASRLGDDVLAAEIRAFAASRQFGLVFEHNRPERMRLYGKAVSAGDVVQVLPERGKKEDATSKLLWRIDAIDGGHCQLSAYRTNSYIENDEEPREAEVDDLVAVAEYDQPIYAGLRETGRVERGGDKPYQVVINGENYHALESLLFCYAGKVDCIYIDPPYNTGAKDWKYNNDYVDGTDEYRHSKWLAMMERRLKIAKKLLNPKDSVLICTIDEKEVHRLGLLLEQLFPNATPQMTTIVIQSAGTKKKGQLDRVEEYAFYVVIGDKGLNETNDDLLNDAPSTKIDKVRWESLLRGGSHSTRRERPNCFYPVFIDRDSGRIVGCGPSKPISAELSEWDTPEGSEAIWPYKTGNVEGVWQMSPDTLMSLVNEGYAKAGKITAPGKGSVWYLGTAARRRIASGEFSITGKDNQGAYIVEVASPSDKTFPAKTVWNRPRHHAGWHGTNLLSNLIPGRKFPFPKSLYAVEDAVRLVVADKPDALIIDFFSGSGTTAHAVMRLNHQDGGHRRCICVTNNEVSEAEEKRLTKQGLRHGDPEWERVGICEYITKPRIKAAITGRTPDSKPIKGDYKFTDEFPMSDGFEENAVFFDLTYQNPDAVELGAAFEEVAPLLWLRAGARGRMIEHEERGFAVADIYAVLFDYSYVREFVDVMRSTPGLSCAFVVTDDAGRFASVKAELGDLECVRLYESYLRSFKIAAEDAVR